MSIEIIRWNFRFLSILKDFNKLNIYTNKRQWKLLLLIVAIVIGFFSLEYTNQLIKKLSDEERKKVELWAEGTRQLANSSNIDQDVTFILEVITKNETVPVILADENDNIISFRNLDESKLNQKDYLSKQLALMKVQHDSIVIDLQYGHKNYIYYKDSTLLTQLSYYPYIQLSLISLFILVSYFAFSSSRKAEQNQVWVGMSKETAHQLGTPISSLMAWMEILDQEEGNKDYVKEMWKDIRRLETVTQRFSKIGSAPVLKPVDIGPVLNNVAQYMKSRTSNRINYQVNIPVSHPIIVPVNASLFEWVIDNLCKNSVDAMDGTGHIRIDLSENPYYVFMDISDTGKGIPKSKFKSIFQPGFTTKERGWGLGLSLSQRIVEQYHKGKIFVKLSELGKGTVIRVLLKKQ